MSLLIPSRIAGKALGPSARLFVRLALCLAVAASFTAYQAGMSVAVAQERNIFQRIFGPRRAAPRPQTQTRTQPQTNAAPRRTQRATAVAPVATEDALVEKVDNASIILVAGDFYAGALARGLETAFAGDAAVRVVNRFNGNSGIVRDDFYDWPNELGAIIDELSPAAVVFMAGANDRQPIRRDGETLDKLSDAWSEAYRSRIQSIANVAANKRVPMFWVSTPPPRSGALSADYLAFNSMLDAQLAVGPGEFIDIWDKFTTDEGAFTSRGPDVNGQLRKLRTNDGLNFTKAGRQKLAFYAEQPLRALLEGRSDAVFAAAAGGEDEVQSLEPAEPVGPILSVAPVSLDALPTNANGLELAGGPAAALRLEKRKAEQTQAGTAPSDHLEGGPKGRADDFFWPK
ncbi:MAG: DUF459 domain-containing protein [Pseudomonadota bacterium]